MGPEVMERIFDPFYTTKEVGKGTGLGLCTVYGIIRSHGGHIQCESAPGRGTVFKIYLPAQEGAIDHPEQDAGEAGPSLRGSETILLVDDDEPLLQLGARMLGANGYTVFEARRGEEALERFQTDPEKLDLVILDLGMPGMGGLRCLKEMMALRPSAKVIVASGYSSLSHMESALAAGAAGFVAKPYRKADLLAAVREVLDGRPAPGRGAA
jgi:CheY-like chemotaxis protein